MKGLSVLLQFKNIFLSERFKVKRYGTCFDSKNTSDLYIFTLCKQFFAWTRICVNQKTFPEMNTSLHHVQGYTKVMYPGQVL